MLSLSLPFGFVLFASVIKKLPIPALKLVLKMQNSTRPVQPRMPPDQYSLASPTRDTLPCWLWCSDLKLLFACVCSTNAVST